MVLHVSFGCWAKDSHFILFIFFGALSNSLIRLHYFQEMADISTNNISKKAAKTI